jgi:N-carbamoylputrescine amidase
MKRLNAYLSFEPFYPQKIPDSDIKDLAETIPGRTTELLSELAKDLNVIIIPNLFELSEDKTFDTSPVINVNGKILGKTRMVHIPFYKNFYEKKYYTSGDLGAVAYDTSHGKIGIAICYDRHFPEYMRALALQGVEIVFIPQAGAIGEWPKGLFEAEMRIASFQNGFFTALCNRVGREEFIEFSGSSFVSDPSGNIIARASEKNETILYCDIDNKRVENSNARKLFLPDRRKDLYQDWNY